MEKDLIFLSDNQFADLAVAAREGDIGEVKALAVEFYSLDDSALLLELPEISHTIELIYGRDTMDEFLNTIAYGLAEAFLERQK